MERIKLYCRTTSARGTTNLRFRLTDGTTVLYYSTGRKIPNKELSVFTPDGTLRPRVTVYNPKLKADIDEYMKAINQAYFRMKSKGMDMRSGVLQAEVNKVMNPDSTDAILHPEGEENLIQRYYRYIEEAYRDGIIGYQRHSQYLSKARRLERFLTIKGFSQIKPVQFDSKMLMDFRQFCFDEYQYVKRYPKLYPKDGVHRYPTQQISSNSVVHEMKALKAFFNEIENTDEIFKSPFRRISHERLKTVMRVMYDEPFFLRASELKKVIETEVPEELQEAKDMFVLNCCLGCRIGDFKNLSMDKVAVSPEGIPYIHYIPHKTMKIMENIIEIKTPLVRVAYNIVMRTRFSFNETGNDRYTVALYNKDLPKLLAYCGIDRKVSKFNETLGENEYFPLYELATSRLARKTHVDMMSKVQVNIYAAGLHAEGSEAVHRYTNMEIEDRFALMNVAFGQRPYRVNPDLTLVKRGRPKAEPKVEETQPEKRRPGRPRKVKDLSASPSSEPTNSTMKTSTSPTPMTSSLKTSTVPSTEVPVKRRPGRPRKIKTALQQDVLVTTGMPAKPRKKPVRPKKVKPEEVVAEAPAPVITPEPQETPAPVKRRPGRPRKTTIPE